MLRASTALSTATLLAIATAGWVVATTLAAPTLELPDDWRTSEPIAFERWLDSTLPHPAAEGPNGTEAGQSSAPRAELDTALRVTLRTELDRMQPAAVRAAAILARLGGAQAQAVLIERLERRVLGPERRSDAGDVVAAAALGADSAAASAPGLAPRLAVLATGDAPHPDLEVRVQCAASALGLGDDSVVPFLLRVLRIDTHEGLADPRPWADVSRSAWARDTAAEALTRRAGATLRFRADAPIRAREDAARELELALEDAGVVVR